MTEKIPEIFKLDDTVFHYCTTNTAIAHILFEKQLRFSPRKNSIDPIENLEIQTSRSMAYFNEKERLELEERNKENVEKIKKELTEKHKNTKQICFCKNELTDPAKGTIHLPAEHFGFLKPRMWDQYGDKYNGVCLSFSRKKLVELHQSNYPDVAYLPYSEMHLNHISIFINELENKGYDQYFIELMDRLDRGLSRKHVDYSGEREFRLYSFGNDNHEFIDILTAINGIIVSRKNLSDFSKQQLVNYSKSMNIPLLYIDWRKTGASITTIEDDEKIYSLIVNGMESGLNSQNE